MPDHPDPLAGDSALLHANGRAGSWGSLGLWLDAGDDYFGACTALATAVGCAAGLKRGDHVLSVACGAGEELRLWQQAFGAALVVGVERDPALARAAQTRAPLAAVHVGNGMALLELGLPEASFDHVLCVDAAYHLHPRADFLRSAWRLLKPGGRLAYTDLVAAPANAARAAVLQGAARLCGLHADGLLPETAQFERLLQLGFAQVQLQRLDQSVLGGFAAFVRRRQWPAWRWPRVAVTAALISPCRAAGLGYAMLSATRPAASAGPASMPSATA